MKYEGKAIGGPGNGREYKSDRPTIEVPVWGKQSGVDIPMYEPGKKTKIECGSWQHSVIYNHSEGAWRFDRLTPDVFVPWAW